MNERLADQMQQTELETSFGRTASWTEMHWKTQQECWWQKSRRRWRISYNYLLTHESCSWCQKVSTVSPRTSNFSAKRWLMSFLTSLPRFEKKC